MDGKNKFKKEIGASIILPAENKMCCCGVIKLLNTLKLNLKIKC